MYKGFRILVSLLAGLVLVGCTLTPAAQPTTEQPAAQPKRVVYLINGALGDNAFYDSGKAGIDALAANYGVETRTIEANFDAGKYEPSLQAAVNYADVIFVISYGFEDQLKAVADKNPDKIFVNLDTVVQNSANTITSVDFIEEESAYLAGVVAGMLTLDTSVPNINPEKIVGVVGGDVDPVVNSFIFAYENGAKSVPCWILQSPPSTEPEVHLNRSMCSSPVREATLISIYSMYQSDSQSDPSAGSLLHTTPWVLKFTA